MTLLSARTCGTYGKRVYRWSDTEKYSTFESTSFGHRETHLSIRSHIEIHSEGVSIGFSVMDGDPPVDRVYPTPDPSTDVVSGHDPSSYLVKSSPKLEDFPPPGEGPQVNF